LIRKTKSFSLASLGISQRRIYRATPTPQGGTPQDGG